MTAIAPTLRPNMVGGSGRTWRTHAAVGGGTSWDKLDLAANMWWDKLDLASDWWDKLDLAETSGGTNSI